MKNLIMKIIYVFFILMIFIMSTSLIYGTDSILDRQQEAANQLEQQRLEEEELLNSFENRLNNISDTNNTNTNTNNYDDNYISPYTTENTSTNTNQNQSTIVGALNTLPESNLGLNNILNILLIVVGVLLVFLAIAILVRLG